MINDAFMISFIIFSVCTDFLFYNNEKTNWYHEAGYFVEKYFSILLYKTEKIIQNCDIKQICCGGALLTTQIYCESLWLVSCAPLHETVMRYAADAVLIVSVVFRPLNSIMSRLHQLKHITHPQSGPEEASELRALVLVVGGAGVGRGATAGPAADLQVLLSVKRVLAILGVSKRFDQVNLLPGPQKSTADRKQDSEASICTHPQ